VADLGNKLRKYIRVYSKPPRPFAGRTRIPRAAFALTKSPGQPEKPS
jgi:hypothetical protein